MKLYSIREHPEYIPAMLESLENHWPTCMPWIKKHMEKVLRTRGPLPAAYLAVEGERVVGGYTLAIQEILGRGKKGLWIPHPLCGPGLPRQAPEPPPPGSRPPPGLGAGLCQNLSGLRAQQLLRKVWVPHHRAQWRGLGRPYPAV